MSTKLNTEEITTAIETTLEQCSLERVCKLPMLQQTIQLARGMRELRQALSDEVVKAIFMPLQGSSLGFRTDKDKDGGYPVHIVRDCLIEAMIRGVRPVGNEFNIIAERCYITKEGFERKVCEYQGVTDIEHEPGVPHMGNGGALVPYRITWRQDGKRYELNFQVTKNADGEVFDMRIPVRVNSGMGADAILGKARRKVLARTYERISGVKLPDGDIIDTTGEAVEREERATNGTNAAVQELVEKHRNSKETQALPSREAGEEG